MRVVSSVFVRTRGRPRPVDPPPEGWGGLPLAPGTYLVIVGAEPYEPPSADSALPAPSGGYDPVAASAVGAALALAERQCQGWEALVRRYEAALQAADAQTRGAGADAPTGPVGAAVQAAVGALAPQLPGVLRALLGAGSSDGKLPSPSSGETP